MLYSLTAKQKAGVIGLSVLVVYGIVHNTKDKNKKSPVKVNDALQSRSKKKKKRVGINRAFLKQMRRLLPIILPGWRSKEAFLLLLHTSALIARTFLSIYVARLDGYIVKSIVDQKLPDFLWNMLKWISIAIPATYTNSMIRFLENKLGIAFRTRLVNHVYSLYMNNTTYYKVGNLDSRIEDPDQRMTQDLEQFCTSIAQLYSQLSKPTFDVVLMTIQLIRLESIHSENRTFAQKLFPAALSIAVSLSTSFILKRASPPFGQLIAQRQAHEGDLRTIHSRLITHAEEVAFYGGHEIEKGILHEAYSTLVKHLNTIYKKRIFYTMLEQFLMKYMWSTTGLLMIAIPTFQRIRNAELKGSQFNDGFSISQRASNLVTSRGVLLNIADAAERIISSTKDVSELAGLAERVSSMIVVFEEIRQGKYVKKQVAGSRLSEVAHGEVKLNDELIELEDVPLVTPSGDLLIESLSLRITPGDHLLITGPNGCGKSSFFRTLGGLWQVQSGVLTRPNIGTAGMFYIPQRPYFTKGTLRQQVVYPETDEQFFAKHDSDSMLDEILGYVHLIPVRDREQGWDARKEWTDVLSGGEKQRLAMARMFYHRPKFAILDECTSAVSMDVEGKMYTKAKELGITLITVSHRPSLWKYHNKVLKFDGQGNASFEDMDPGERLSLHNEKSQLEHYLQAVESKKRRLRELYAQLGEDPNLDVDLGPMPEDGLVEEAIEDSAVTADDLVGVKISAPVSLSEEEQSE